MVTGGQLALGLGHVEGATVGLSITGDEEHDKSDDSGHVTLYDEPAPGAALSLDDARDLHRARQDDGGYEAEAQRHLVGDHLHGSTHGRHDRILVVRSPSCHEDAHHAD